MLKKLRPKLILTSIITLFPMTIGLFFWNRLPAEIVTSWNVNGVPNGTSSKLFAVFGLPFFLLAVHLICIFATSADPKNSNISNKLMDLILWICPACSIFTGCTIYGEALGIDMQIEHITPILVGLIFICVGNYLPKCQPNYTVGIKIPWTMNSAENWRRTHRFAGPVWMIGGILVILLSFIGFGMASIAILLIISLVPSGYSYWYYRTYEAK